MDFNINTAGKNHMNMESMSINLSWNTNPSHPISRGKLKFAGKTRKKIFLASLLPL